MLNLCSKTLNVSKKTGHREGRGPKFESKVFSCKKKKVLHPLIRSLVGYYRSLYYHHKFPNIYNIILQTIKIESNNSGQPF